LCLRYLSTKLSPLVRYLFPASDDLILNDGQDNPNVEPEFYLPIIPLVLVNGAQGLVFAGCYSLLIRISCFSRIACLWVFEIETIIFLNHPNSSLVSV